MATIEELQEENGVQDTQMPSMSPPHDTNEPTKIIIVKDVFYSSAQNIDPLTREHQNQILDQSIVDARSGKNIILVSIDELHKVVADITRDKVNTQEQPFSIASTSSGQPLIQILLDSSKKVNRTIKVDLVKQRYTTIEEKEKTKDQPNAQTQGPSQITVID